MRHTLTAFFLVVLIALLLVAAIGCGSAGTPSAPPTTVSTGTDTGTGTSTTPAPPVLTPAQKQTIIDTITKLGGSGVELGLDEWAKANNKLATEVATTMKTNIEAAILPELNGQTTTPSADLNALVSSNMYINIPPLVQLAIEGGGVILDSFFQVPGVKESDKVDFIRAFVVAIDNGVNKYLAEPPAIGSVVAKHALAKSVKK